MNIYADAVAAYQAAGWPSVLPVERKELQVKGVTGRQGRMPEPIDYKKWLLRWAEKNAALRLPKYLVGIDVDAYDGKPGAETLAELEQRWGQLPRTIRSSARIGDQLSGIRFYRVPGEAEVATEFPGIEIIQFHHRYAVVWPSVHPDLGTQYRWWSTDGEMLDRVPQPMEFPWLPDGWWEGLRALAPASGEPGGASGDSQSGAAGTRSTLAALLANAPDGASGRNNWLTRVAGHLAKVIPWQDGYEALLAAIDAGLAVPYESTDAGGIHKLAVSVWETEQRGKIAGDGELPRQETGWLAGDGEKLWCLVEIGKDAAKTTKLVECSDFDMRVVGVHIDSDAGTQYRVHVNGRLSGGFDTTVAAAMFGAPRELNPWLSNRRLHFYDIKGDIGNGTDGQRLSIYLGQQSLEAPELHIVDYLGWHEPAGGFVTHEGVITAGGLEPSTWVPNAKLSKVDDRQHTYGFNRTAEDATRLLREVLTFHDETAASVFGAWWAACLLKPQIMAKTALFPFMALEAPSESGKSTGFFSLMIQLNGAVKLQTAPTIPTMRDAMAANRSGIVWADDMDDMKKVYELLRQATAEGTKSKKAMDHTTTINIPLVAPVVISGEGFQELHEERALIDRSIVLTVPSPAGRQSLYGDYSQWDDIIEVRNTYGDRLNHMAGWYVQGALQNLDVLDELTRLRVGNGRHGDKLGIVRMGARLLDRLTHSEGTHTQRVDAWVDTQEPAEGDYLLNAILPTLWRRDLYSRTSRQFAAVYMDPTGIIWFHEGRVADAWRDLNRHDPRALQLGSPAAITNQRAHAEIAQSQTRAIESGRNPRRKRYFALSEQQSQAVIERAGYGDDVGGPASDVD